MLENTSEDIKVKLNKSSCYGDTGLIKRARAKYMTRSIVLHLVNLNSSLQKSYWNTYHCSDTLEQKGNKITGHYCKNRWCLLCNRIRTAVTINAYKPIIENWKNKQLVTLTIPNIKEDILLKSINDMMREFSNINRVLKYRNNPIKAVRKLEITYNPISDTYHPHFHLLVDGEVSALLIVEEWLKRYPTANQQAQDIRPCDSEDSLLEIFKYFTKIITKKSKSAKLKNCTGIYIYALDVIFNVMKNRRTFQNYGFNVKQEVEDEDFNVNIDDEVSETYVWEWQQELYDWVNDSTGESLTGYSPANELLELLGNNIYYAKSQNCIHLDVAVKLE